MNVRTFGELQPSLPMRS